MQISSSQIQRQRPQIAPKIPPFTYDRGRGGKSATYIQAHRNRSLVLNQKSTSKDNEEEVDNLTSTEARTDNQIVLNQSSTPAFTSWVSKRDRHMQLINSSVYEKNTLSRNKAMKVAREQKSRHNDLREKQKIKKHIQLIATGRAPAASTNHSLLIDGLRFQVCNDGSKLVRETSTWILHPWQYLATVFPSSLMVIV